MLKRRFVLNLLMIFMLVSGLGIQPVLAAPSPAPPAQATTALNSGALVLVNSSSAYYADFQHYIQPYLDHLGVPYTTLNITAAPVGPEIADYAVIITGHRQLDVGGVYLDATEQGYISAAVSAGTGLVNFDNDLSVSGAPRYQFIETIFNFDYTTPGTGSGVTFTSEGGGGYQINCWEDDHQDPILATTTDPLALIEDDNLWTEFEWVQRGYPGVFGGYDETLPLMRFYGAVPDGEYELSARLYWSHNLRYFWGYSAANPQEFSLDVTSGVSGDFADYNLGTVTVTGGQFELFVQNADPLAGGVDYEFFGWAWVRLVPVGAPPAVMHYITASHESGETISTGTMTMAGITLPDTADALAMTGSQPFLAVTTSGLGHAVQFGSYNWMSYSVKGPMYALDDLVWRSIVWAARKPFVMQGLPPFLTMRVDDESGPFNWIHVANEFGFIPWAGLFFHNVDNTEAADLSALVNAGLATTSIHAFNGSFFYYNHGVGDYPDATIAANFAEGTQWHLDHNIPISKFVLPHYYEFGTNVFQGLSDWGVEFVGTMMNPGNGYGAPWIMNGPFRLFETGSSSWGGPVYYSDFMSVPGHPEFDDQFFNCVTEIRDDAGYEWYPSNDVAASVGRGTRQSERALDNMALATLFTHGYYTAGITETNWRAILQGITDNLASYNPINVSMDYACQYVRAMHTSNITNALYDPDTRQVVTTLGGETDMPTKFYLFLEEGPDIRHLMVDVPTFSGSTDVAYTLAGPLDHIVVTPNPATVAVAGSQQFTAQGYDADDNPIPNLPFTWSVVNGGGTINASGLFTAGSTPGLYSNTVQASFGGVNGFATVEVVAPALHHFTFAPITSPQYAGAPFQITITARDISGNLLPGYTGTAALSDSTGTIDPTVTGNFNAGMWSGDVTIGQVAHDVIITAADGAVTGASAPFEVEGVPGYYRVTSPSYTQTAGVPFPVTVTAFQTQIDLWEDNHQDPVLATTTDVNTLINNSANALWTEFLYTPSRPYPSIMASVLHTTGLATMHFYASGIPNGRYNVIANLYDNAAMRYYFGYTAADPRAQFVQVPGGATGTQHREYSLGTVQITDNTFNLYTNYAELVAGGYDIFGWAWIRLTPVEPAALTINLWEDSHQDPVLATTSVVADLKDNDGLWTEFLYTPSRPYPTILAHHLEYENYGLGPMHFYADGIPNGIYTVIANLYDNAGMRYFYGYDPANPLANYVDVPGGATGTQHREYTLGMLEITDGSFDLYVQDAQLLSGTYGWFGWAWVRLVPQNLITMSSSSATMLFDGDGDGVFGEPGDERKALVGGTLDINARETLTDTNVSIIATDMLGQSGANSYTILHGAPVSLEITPAEETITAGDSVIYSATASDAYGNTWNVTGETVFSIQTGAGGSWLDNSYYSENPGDWTVTGEYAGLSDTALLHVTAMVEPTCVTIQRDSYGTVFDTYLWQSIPTGSYGASARVSTGSKLHPRLGAGETRTMLYFDLGFLPAGVTIQSATLGVSLADAGSGEPIGVYRVTQPWSENQPTWDGFASAYDAGVEWSSFNASGPGFTTNNLTALVAAWANGVYANHGVMLINRGSGAYDQYYASEWAQDNHPWLEVCYLALTHGAPVAIEVTPASASVVAGESLSYQATARDNAGITWDVTATTSFSIEAGAGGSWAANTYTSENPGTWTVTGQFVGLSDTASLSVGDHGPAVSLEIAPAEQTVSAGDTAAYSATATDALGNTWDVSAMTSFSIQAGAGGSWAANVYTSQFAGDWTVTGEYAGFSDTALLHVVHGAAVSLEVTPAEESVAAGGAVSYSAAALDAQGNAWDVTAMTSFSIEAGAGGAWAANIYTSENIGDWTVTGEYAGLSDTALLHVLGGAPTCVVVQRGAFGTVADTYIWESLATLQNGGSSRMSTGDKLHPRRGLGETRSLLQFDLSFLPTGAAIQSASLGVYVVDGGSGEPVGVYRVTQPWSENAPTWDTFATAYDPAFEWGSFNATNSTYATTDLTALVTEWANGLQPNYGVMLINLGSGAYDQYYTSEWTESRPQLEVCYIAAAP